MVPFKIFQLNIFNDYFYTITLFVQKKIEKKKVKEI